MNLAITHCKHGHKFTTDNTIIKSSGTRKCRECAKQYLRDRRTSLSPSVRKAIARNENVKYRYGISNKEYCDRLSEQGWKCANPFCPVVETPERRLHIDHDHECCSGIKTCGKCIRGLLCNSCNHILGLAADSPERLSGLVEYLTTWKRSLIGSMSEMTPTI